MTPAHFLAAAVATHQFSEPLPIGDPRAACMVYIDGCMLAQLMQLPEGVVIEAAHTPHDRPGGIFLRLRGVGERTPPGWVLHQVMLVVHRAETAPGGMRIEWEFPQPKAEG